MCITEYNEAETMQMFKEEGREEERSFVIGNLLRSGMSAEDVARISGVSLNNMIRFKRICKISVSDDDRVILSKKLSS